MVHDCLQLWFYFQFISKAMRGETLGRTMITKNPQTEHGAFNLHHSLKNSRSLGCWIYLSQWILTAVFRIQKGQSDRAAYLFKVLQPGIHHKCQSGARVCNFDFLLPSLVFLKKPE